MPLKPSTTKKNASYNINELMHSHKQGGKFAKGKGAAKAHQMAVAAAFNVKRPK